MDQEDHLDCLDQQEAQYVFIQLNTYIFIMYMYISRVQMDVMVLMAREDPLANMYLLLIYRFDDNSKLYVLLISRVTLVHKDLKELKDPKDLLYVSISLLCSA